MRVDLTVDGYGSPNLSREFIGAMTAAGARFHVFDPTPRIFGLRAYPLRRLHRKIVAVDGRVAFVGGINYSADHLESFGPDGQAGLRGARRRAARRRHPRLRQPDAGADAAHALQVGAHPARAARNDEAPHVGDAEAALSSRATTGAHRDDIERDYRTAIRSARDEVIIANAYFFPGWRLLRDMVRASRRGVRVQLILQGQPDMRYVRTAARLLYPSLVKDGVQIYEYCRRPLHAKVAVVDGQWCTVGSSNLDPLSLSLNLEANVVVNDRGFAGELRQRLQQLEREHCRLIRLDTCRGAPAGAMC